jgi:hypothetical protein
MILCLFALLGGMTTSAMAAETVNVLDYRDAAILDTFTDKTSFDPPVLDLSKTNLSANNTRARF